MSDVLNFDRQWSPSNGDSGVDDVLRAKYADYCSARISEIFLSLSDDRIYDLMEQAARESGLDPGELGYRSMVRLVTRKLHASVPLPDLEEWAEDYRRNPERYDPFLLGLWESPAGHGSGNGGGEEPR